MKYISPCFDEIKEDDPYKKIACVAHNCYQVTKAGDDKAFVSRLLGFKHYAMIEHKMYAAQIEESVYDSLIKLNNRFIVLAQDGDSYYCSFSLRPLLEEENLVCSPLYQLFNILDEESKSLFSNIKSIGTHKGKLLSEEEISSLPNPVYKKIKNVTIRIVTDRGVTHEIVRHRLASYAQESTRYCNYAKDKFGNELTFIMPLDYSAHKDTYDKSFKEAEENYFALLKEGATPEMARAVLPNKLKATIIMTANVDEWEKFFSLRCSQRAHPDMREIADPIHDYFKKEGYLR